MKKSTGRGLGILLTVCMVIGLFSATAFARTGEPCRTSTGGNAVLSRMAGGESTLQEDTGNTDGLIGGEHSIGSLGRALLWTGVAAVIISAIVTGIILLVIKRKRKR